MNTWKKLPKRQKKQGRSSEKKKEADTPALEEACKSGTCSSAAASEKDEVSFEDGAEAAEDASRGFGQDRSAEDLGEPADELEDQLMKMFSPSAEAFGGRCLGTGPGDESENRLQDVDSGWQASMEPTSQDSLKQARDCEEAKMLTQEDGYVGINDCGIGASGNILDEDLSLPEESGTNLTTLALAGEEGGKETSLEERSATPVLGPGEPVLGPGEPVLVETRGTELVARQADVISSQFAQELITRYSAVKTEVPNSCWEYPDKEANEEEDSECDDVIILEELSEEDMQLALSRRADFGEDDADVSSKESLAQSSPIPPPNHESDDETDMFIKSVQDALAAARSRRRFDGDTEAIRKESRLGVRRGCEGGEKLQTVERQTAEALRGRSKTRNQQERRRTKTGGGEQEEGKCEEDSPSRKRIKRFLLNEEERENRRNGTKPPGPNVKVAKVEERKGQKRPRERESRPHLDQRDSCSPMPKIPKLAHLGSGNASNSRKFSYKFKRLTFAEILKKEGVESALKLQPLLKPLCELPVWVESETMSMREETMQEREDREKREKRIARFGSSTVQLGEQEQQEWQEQEWQQLREVQFKLCSIVFYIRIIVFPCQTSQTDFI